ncbi:MAG TPA: MarR family transcriptional regulator [Calditrichia bacterium]|nr:MarR family transcriptional regulator [Calditrichota bacterium]HQV33040.1 MarR family transcriptional regulator [Calditrichia bacterium]
MSDDVFQKLVQDFNEQMVDLIKKYQFRDRDQITCHGISVSQCYTLQTLFQHGAMNMNDLADKMYLSVSTLTRVVDQLVQKGYVLRTEGAEDRRVRCITLTPDGRGIFEKCWGSVRRSEETILAQFEPEIRPVLVDFIRRLNQAVGHWQSCCREDC